MLQTRPEASHGASTQVLLRVYDLSEGKAAKITPLVMKKPIRGVWHSSIQVFGLEYFYGGFIDRMPPACVEKEIGLVPEIITPLGVTRKSRRELERFLKEIDHDFTPETYDLLEWNCNHFADVCARFLLNNRGIPRAILKQPARVAKSIVGRAVLSFLQMAQMNQNPFTTEGLRRRRSDDVPRASFRPTRLLSGASRPSARALIQRKLEEAQQWTESMPSREELLSWLPWKGQCGYELNFEDGCRIESPRRSPKQRRGSTVEGQAKTTSSSCGSSADTHFLDSRPSKKTMIMSRSPLAPPITRLP